MNKRLPRMLPLRVSEQRYFIGFEYHCRAHLEPIVRNGRAEAPNPSCVRRILKDERPSRKMLLNIFRNAPELLGHPLAHPAVVALYGRWKRYGTIPDAYGRGMPQKTAKDCKTKEE